MLAHHCQKKVGAAQRSSGIQFPRVPMGRLAGPYNALHSHKQLNALSFCFYQLFFVLEDCSFLLREGVLPSAHEGIGVPHNIDDRYFPVVRAMVVEDGLGELWNRHFTDIW